MNRDIPTSENPFVRVGTTLYKIVSQPRLNGGHIKKRIVWNNETLRQDYGLSLIHILRAHETPEHLVCRLLLEKKKKEVQRVVYQSQLKEDETMADLIYSHQRAKKDQIQ